MKKLLFTIIFTLALTGILYADEWTKDNLDLRKAIKNDKTPPARLEPVHKLEPLNEIEGVIRRVKIQGDKKAISLTFDMCELETVTTGCDMDIINFLRERKIPATLFMGGKWIRTHSRRVKQIMTEDIFEIGNHNWSHGNCALLSDEELKNQILWTQAQYELLREEAQIKNSVPVPTLFRLPYGRNSEHSLKIISDLGLRIIQWDVAVGEGDNSTQSKAKRNAKLIAKNTKPGSIILLHANLVPKGTANLVREIVNELQAQDYIFVKVSDLLKMGEPETVKIGYFITPGDNVVLDKKFGVDGTGRKAKR